METHDIKRPGDHRGADTLGVERGIEADEGRGKIKDTWGKIVLKMI